MKTRLDLQVKKSSQLFIQHSPDDKDLIKDTPLSASTSCSDHKKKWKRNRKNYEQVQVLVDEYNINSCWSKESVVALAEKTGLSEAQVYKWGWDYKKKLRKQASKVNIRELLCSEVIAPSKIDLDMDCLQRNYKNIITYSNGFVSSQLFY
jgi:hypothetical protein